MAGKIERAYAPKDVKALDCALVYGLETVITSVAEGEIEYPNKIPDDAKYSNYYSKQLANNIVEKVECAKENEDQEMLDNILCDLVEAIFKTTFLGDTDQKPDHHCP